MDTNATSTPSTSADAAPVTNPAPVAAAPVIPPAPKASAGSLGTTIALVLVLAIVLIGALYFWGSTLSESNPAPSQETTTTINVEASI